MAIITLDMLYSVLSCRLTPPDALFVLYGRCAGSGCTNAFPGSRLHQEQATRRFGPKLLVGFWCENTCHVGSPNLSSGQDQTCLWNLARGMPMEYFLEELATGQGTGPAPDLAEHGGRASGVSPPHRVTV
jgi:hypothetical protein